MDAAGLRKGLRQGLLKGSRELWVLILRMEAPPQGDAPRPDRERD